MRETDDPDDDAARGGDPACWLGRVCPECGRFSEQEPPTRCANCGAEIDED